MASAASVAVGSSLTVRESLARVRSPRASARLPATPTVSWKKIVSNLASSATWVMWAYSLKSISAVGTASGWRQPARWLPGTLKKPPRRSCLLPLTTVTRSESRLAGGAPLQWRVMVFRTAGLWPAHDHEEGGTPAVQEEHEKRAPLQCGGYSARS